MADTNYNYCYFERLWAAAHTHALTHHKQFLARSVYFILDREITKFGIVFSRLFQLKFGTWNG